MNKVLLTLTALAVFASTDAIAQRGRPTTERPGTRESQDPSRSQERVREERRRANPGLTTTGAARSEGQATALVATAGRLATGLNRAERTAFERQLNDLIGSAEVGPLFRDVLTEIVAKESLTGETNAKAVVALLAAYSKRGLLNETGISAEFVLADFLGKQALTIVKEATPNQAFIDTLKVVAEKITQGSSVKDAWFEGVTRNINDPAAKEAEMTKFCSQCPGACK